MNEREGRRGGRAESKTHRVFERQDQGQGLG